MSIEKLYDEEADHYDTDYQQEQYRNDEKQTTQHIKRLGPLGSVISQGIGTGQDIEIAGLEQQPKDMFLGLDISQKMIDEAKKKYPNHNFRKWNCKEVFPQRADTILSLFGTINYVSLSSFFEQIISSGSTTFCGVMFSPNYNPPLGSEYVTHYTRDQVEALAEGHALSIDFRPLYKEWKEDYWVITNRI